MCGAAGGVSFFVPAYPVTKNETPPVASQNHGGWNALTSQQNVVFRLQQRRNLCGIKAEVLLQVDLNHA